MLIVTCPVCGASGDETDFHAGGLHFERWRCDRGCGKWFHAARDTMTMEFKAFYGITELPPKALMKQAKGPWAEYFKARAGEKS